MKNKPESPIKKNLEEIHQVAKTGISKDDKQFLLDELDSMIATLEDWKDNNQPMPKKKAS